MGMFGGNPSFKMNGLGSIFQSELKNSMATEILEEYVLASTEAAYENPGEQAPMGLMALGREHLCGCTRNVHHFPP